MVSRAEKTASSGVSNSPFYLKNPLYVFICFCRDVVKPCRANKLSLYASGGISPKTEREEKGRLNGSFSDDDAIPEGGGMGWIGRRKEETNNIKYSFY